MVFLVNGETTFRRGWFFLFQDCREEDCRIIGIKPSNTQFTKSSSVNPLARPNAILHIIGYAYDTAAVYDGNCTKTRISGDRKVGQSKRISENFADRGKRNTAIEIIN